MKVHEFIKILQEFKDQDADVVVIEHSSGTGYYDQGGNIKEVAFNKDIHFEHTDLRGNPHAKHGSSTFNLNELLIGARDI